MLLSQKAQFIPISAALLVHLHQGLLLSSANIDANKTVVPDIFKMLSSQMQQWVI